MSKALEQLAAVLITHADGFASPGDLALAIDNLVRERIESAAGVLVSSVKSETRNAALGRDALILPPTDIACELRKAWGRT